MTKSFSTEIQSVAVLEVNGEIARIVREFVTALIASAVGNDQCNVVVLLAGAELLKFINHRPHQSFCWKMAMPTQRLHKALLPEFLVGSAAAFGDTVGVKRERVSWAQRKLRHLAIKFPE
jgi:hypothetical protein